MKDTINCPVCGVYEVEDALKPRSDGTILVGCPSNPRHENVEVIVDAMPLEGGKIMSGKPLGG